MRGHARRRGAGWQLAVYVGRASNGQRTYIYEAMTGSKRDADRRLAQLIAEVDSGRRTAPTSATIRRLARRLVGDRDLGAVADDAAGVPAPVGCSDPAGARYEATHPGHDDELDRYYVELGDGRAPGGGALSPRSIRHIHAVISGMFTTAVRWGWIASSPAERARLPRLGSTRIEAPEPGDVVRLLEGAESYTPEFGTFLRMAVATGARRGALRSAMV